MLLNPSAPSKNMGAAATASDAGAETLKTEVIKVLRNIYDPEIPVNIYDLGLIYGIEVRGESEILVTMTLTAPGCPVAQTFPGMVEATVAGVDGVKAAHVEL